MTRERPLVSAPATPRLTYVAGVASDPVFLGMAVPTAAVGLGALGAFGTMIGLVGLIILGMLATRFAIVRRRLDRRRAERARQRCEAKRLEQLSRTGPIRKAQYLELRQLVDEIEATGGAEVVRCELTELLDYFVLLAVSHEQHHKTLRLVGLDGTGMVSARSSSARGTEIAERRRVQSAECRARADRIADELDAIEELIKLIVLRTGCPTAERDWEHELPRRLWEIDEIDRGMRQLTELCA